MKTMLKLVMLSLFVTSIAQAQTNPNLINWYLSGDIVGTTGSKDADIDGDFYFREFELMAYSAIDHTWDGVLALAYHKESISGEEHIEIHEAYAKSSKLFNSSTIKVGKFFLGFGRLNRFHRHDWAFTDAPYVNKSFFGNEAVKDAGIEYTRNISSVGSYLTLGVTKGDEFNHTHGHEHEAHEAGHVDRAKAPTAYVRFAKFYEFSPTRGLETALNLINRHDAEGIKYQYTGLDFAYKNREGKVLKTFFQGEIWGRTATHEEDDEEEKFEDLGAYIYYEKGIDENKAIGLRIDYYKPDEHEEEAGEEHNHKIDGIEVDEEYNAVSLNYTYKNSEFFRTRYTLEHATGIKVDDDEDVSSLTRAYVQFTFSLGAHPAHLF